MKRLFFTLTCLAFLCVLQAQVLYGTTSNGGNGGGTISWLEPRTGMLSANFTFEEQDGENAAWYSKLVEAKDGRLYGMTYTGGSNGYGTIFSYNPATEDYTKLMDFDGTNGRFPYNSLIQASDGKLYGMTNQGGIHNRGVVFSYDPAIATYTRLVDFDGTNGAYPAGSLMQASNGRLYGMTQNGGTNDFGVIFSFDIATGVYTKLSDFDGNNGKYPLSNFVQASDGTLYAMTFNGGINNWGIIFSYNPVMNVFTKLY